MSSVALVAVQLEVTLDALEGGDRYRVQIEKAAHEAVQAAEAADHRVLVFPEACGHLVPLALGPAAARRTRTVTDAMLALALRRPWRAWRGVLRGTAGATDRWMRATFGAIARRHGATVVAGSYLRAHRGRVRNSSLTFAPDGEVAAITDKVNLVPFLEDGQGGLGLAPGRAGDVRVVDAGWGGLATAICYDGFREPHTDGERFQPLVPVLDALGADVIANPAANPWPWELGWVHAAPGEHLLRVDQWRREGLPASLAACRHARWGVTAHLVATLLDQRFEGVSEILERRGDAVVPIARAAHPRRGGHAVAVVDVAHAVPARSLA